MPDSVAIELPDAVDDDDIILAMVFAQPRYEARSITVTKIRRPQRVNRNREILEPRLSRIVETDDLDRVPGFDVAPRELLDSFDRSATVDGGGMDGVKNPHGAGGRDPVRSHCRVRNRLRRDLGDVDLLRAIRADFVFRERGQMLGDIGLDIDPRAVLVANAFAARADGQRLLERGGPGLGSLHLFAGVVGTVDDEHQEAETDASIPDRNPLTGVVVA